MPLLVSGSFCGRTKLGAGDDGSILCTTEERGVLIESFGMALLLVALSINPKSASRRRLMH